MTKPTIRTRESEEVRAELQRYLALTGLTIPDFARRINYGTSSLHIFHQGRYPGDGKLMCRAIRDFIATHPVTAQTEIEGTLYETANVSKLRRVFYECLDKQRAGVVYGPPGSQKSFALRHLVAELNRNEVAGHQRSAYLIYCREGLRPRQLLKRIAKACGVSPIGDADHILDNLRFEFGKRRILIAMDEAQHLDVKCLETVRELLDELGCGLLFAGSHDLIRTFKKSVELEQWNSRLRTVHELPGITDEEAAHIVKAELGDVSEKKMAGFLQDARVPDIRKKEDYISARRLFYGVTAIKEHAGAGRTGGVGSQVQ